MKHDVSAEIERYERERQERRNKLPSVNVIHQGVVYTPEEFAALQLPAVTSSFMPYDPKADHHLLKAMKRFADAAAEYAFLGTIPVYSNDKDEQEAIDAARSAVIHERKHSEKLLLALIWRRVNKHG